MSEIKSGSIAVMRTTEEPVFVLGIKSFTQWGAVEDTSDLFPFRLEDVDVSGIASGKLAFIRRPVQTDQGIEHKTSCVFLEELESQDAKEKRMMEKYIGYTETQKALHNDKATQFQS